MVELAWMRVLTELQPVRQVSRENYITASSNVGLHLRGRHMHTSSNESHYFPEQADRR